MKKELKSKKLPPIPRTAEGLRDALFDEINLLRIGKTTTPHSRAIASLAHQLIEAARLEFQSKKFITSQKEHGSLRLGS